jgi:hypothetical protein
MEPEVTAFCETGRQWAALAPRSMPLRIDGKLNPKAIALCDIAFDRNSLCWNACSALRSLVGRRRHLAGAGLVVARCEFRRAKSAESLIHLSH